MGLRQRLSTSFAVSPDADKIATNQSNAPGLKFPFADRRAKTVFNPIPATLRPLSAESGLLSSAQDGCDDAGVAATVKHRNDRERIFIGRVADEVVVNRLAPQRL
jgi:hypothetical protein